MKTIVTRPELLQQVKENFLNRWNKLQKKYGDDTSEHNFYSWVSSYVKNKSGLDIACGDWKIPEAIGVDILSRVAVTENGFICRGDNLYLVETESQDFVMSNYLECFLSPLITLREWHRVLKRDGDLFLCVLDAEDSAYTKSVLGPLANKKRNTCFTEQTLKFYLNRAKFNILNLEKQSNLWIHVRCKKS